MIKPAIFPEKADAFAYCKDLLGHKPLYDKH